MIRRCISRRLLRQLKTLLYLFSTFIAIYGLLHLRTNHFVVDFYYAWVNPDFSVETWNVRSFYCEDNMIVYGDQFALLRGVTVNPGQKHIFCLPCKGSVPVFTFFERKDKNHLNDWISHMCVQNSHDEQKLAFNDKFTVAVHNYEYANLYKAMNDWYNIYLETRLVGQAPDNISILITESHSHGPLDNVWTTLFKHVERLDEMTTPVVYSQLMWSMTAYNSPMFYHYVQNPLPFIEDFQTFFINKHGIEKAKELHCKNISIVFLSRRNYVFQTGNKNDQVEGKVKNEDELITTVQKSMLGHIVKGIQLDQMSMSDQLKIVTNTDIFIAMHGAGMTHVLFLPSHAGVLELLPNYLIMPYPHFKSLSRWRGLHYDKWHNPDPKLEYSDFSTYISPTVVKEKVLSLYSKMCRPTK